MADKKRITHIGKMKSVQGTSKLQCSDGLAQADCNVVRDILESMNKSKIMSYKELQEFKSKPNCISQPNNSKQNSSKQNSKLIASKQKKFIPEKSFPLMAKCQQSMKYLKKNRCIPKPRAHVGFVPKPPQKPMASLKLIDIDNNVSDISSKSFGKKHTRKMKHPPEIQVQSKISRCLDNFQENTLTESSNKVTEVMTDTEADSELERFYEKHHPSNCRDDYSSDTSAGPRKKRKRNKIKRKKEKKQIVYTAKINRGKITRKALTESEESSGSQIKKIGSNLKFAVDEHGFIEDSDGQFSSKRFQRIINYDDSLSDDCINDYGTINCDSFNSSDDENMLIKSANEKNPNCVKDSNHSVGLDICPNEPGSAASFKLKDTSNYNFLKLKCKMPCSVVIKRDPLLDQKVASLRNDSLSVTNTKTASSFDDDCVIISESLNNSLNNMTQPKENVNLFQGKSVVTTKSLPCSDVLSVPKVCIRNEKLKSVSTSTPQAETNLLLHDKMSAGVCCDKDVSLKMLEDKVGGRETELIYSKIERCPEKEKYFSSSEKKDLHKNSYFLDNEDLSAATESETFNVHIVSVKSLNESDIIVLSDDSEEKDMETVPIANKTNEITEDDSDIEICLDSSIVSKENSENIKIQGVSNSKSNNIIVGIKENSSSIPVKPSVFNDEDCIILDEAHASSGSSSKHVQMQSSQINTKEVKVINNDINSSDKEMSISNNTPNKNRSSILKILDTIDFNCINKVLNKTSSLDNQVNKESVVQNSLCKNIETLNKTVDSFNEKPNQSLTNACVSEQQVSTGAIVNDGFSKIGKISSLNISNTQEETMKNVSKSVPNPVTSNHVPSGIICDKSSPICNSSTKHPATKLSGSEKGTIVLNHKTEVNSQNQQLLPLQTKIESCENASDILDILASESIGNLDEIQKQTVRPLMELYQTEYKKFIEIKCTEKNVTAGLKLLEEKQALKLMHISSSIKNLAKNDICFHKVKNEFLSKKSDIKNSSPKTSKCLDKIEILECAEQPSVNNLTDMKKSKVKIFNPSVVEGASEILRSQSVGPSSNQEVYKHLINSVCAECGEYATSACSGCHKVFYCSVKCGMSFWNKGHNAVCKK